MSSIRECVSFFLKGKLKLSHLRRLWAAVASSNRPIQPDFEATRLVARRVYSDSVPSIPVEVSEEDFDTLPAAFQAELRLTRDEAWRTGEIKEQEFKRLRQPGE